MRTVFDPLSVIRADRLLAIVRLPHPDDTVAEALASAGLRAVEVSLASGDAFATIRRWCSRYEDALVVGAGTVLTRDDAERAVEAGARYIVSPAYDEAVDGWLREVGVLYVPGALTPTEVQRVLAADIPLVKLFPAIRLGPEYVRDLLAPFPQVRILATGGIDKTNAGAFIKAGAVAVAVGSSLVRSGRTSDELAAEAAELRDQITPTTEGGERDAD